MTRNFWIGCAVGVGLLLTAGFYFLRSDGTAELARASDRQVGGWVEQMKGQDAISFLEGGGKYHVAFDLDDEPDGSSMNIDREVILPLLRRLREQLDVAVMALIDDSPGEAFALVIDLEKYRSEEADIRLFFDREDEAFSGVIPRQFGDRWFHFEVVDEREAAETDLGKNWQDDFE